MSPSTTRWSPTPEQLMILEEMYKGGLRTPNATQIQKITSHLSFYGKIEGKNVFYWFQNHKARDRQKLRKKLILTKQQQLQFQHKYFSPNSNIIINNYPPSSDDAVLSLIDPPPPPPPPAVAALHLHALHHQYDRYAEYLRLQGVSDDDGGTARLTNDGGNGGDDDWMMTTTTTTKKTVSSSSMTSDLQAPVGPTCTLPCCTSTTNYYYYNNNNRPLKTLELFPVTSPSLAKDHQINTNGANTNLFLHKN